MKRHLTNLKHSLSGRTIGSLVDRTYAEAWFFYEKTSLQPATRFKKPGSWFFSGISPN